MIRLTRFIVKVSLLLFAWLGSGITFSVLVELIKTCMYGGPWGWVAVYLGCVIVVLAIITELIPDMGTDGER